MGLQNWTGVVKVRLGSGFVSGHTVSDCPLLSLDLSFWVFSIGGSRLWVHFKITGKLNKQTNKPVPEPHSSPNVAEPLGVEPGNSFNSAKVEDH